MSEPIITTRFDQLVNCHDFLLVRVSEKCFFAKLTLKNLSVFTTPIVTCHFWV